MANQASSEDMLDFYQPWELSDVVLVVEEERFHVHRSILGMWSPVFSTMFTAQFKEKTAEEVPLPGKKASEIKEMLLVIYPTSAKPIDDGNYLFLLKLAKEYMMTKLTKKCEIYLKDRLEKPPWLSGFGIFGSFGRCYDTTDCLTVLDIAQTYELERLQTACNNRAKSMDIEDLKRHDIYNNISFPNYRAIVEGMIERMKEELRCSKDNVSQLTSDSEKIKTKYKSTASDALKQLEEIISLVVFRICMSDNSSGRQTASGTDEKLNYIKRSDGEFKNLHGPLTVLRDKLKACQACA